MSHLSPYACCRIVTLSPDADLHHCMGECQAHGAHSYEPLPLINGFLCLCDDHGKQAIAAHQDVQRVEDDAEVHLVISPIRSNATQKSNQFIPEGISAVRAPAAWAVTRGTGVGVAIIDTGIDLAHPDLRANIAGGVNLVNPRRTPQDDNGHGTHVAGTVAAADNTIGVVGVAPRASLYAVKVLDRNGSGYLSNVIRGLQWVANLRIPVANMSLSSSLHLEAFHLAVKNAAAAGVTVVAAAGNRGGSNSVEYPARYPEVIAVSAVTLAGQLASFSSNGPEVDLAAPGVGVLSTMVGRRYGRLNGTSMASPHVAGVAALYLSLHPGSSAAQVRAALMNTATQLPGLTAEQQGAGRVDANGAVHASAEPQG